jgi:hypothetical protein
VVLRRVVPLISSFWKAVLAECGAEIMSRTLLLLAVLARACATIIFGGYSFESAEPWNLPVWPLKQADYKPSFQNYTKKIPRLLWIGYKKAPKNESDVSNHLRKMMAKNSLWKPHLIGAEEQHKFMEDHFPNTSLLWAFKSVNPIVGVPHSDIWRFVQWPCCMAQFFL